MRLLWHLLSEPCQDSRNIFAGCCEVSAAVLILVRAALSAAVLLAILVASPLSGARDAVEVTEAVAACV